MFVVGIGGGGYCVYGIMIVCFFNCFCLGVCGSCVVVCFGLCWRLICCCWCLFGMCILCSWLRVCVWA